MNELKQNTQDMTLTVRLSNIWKPSVLLSCLYSENANSKGQLITTVLLNS